MARYRTRNGRITMALTRIYQDIDFNTEQTIELDKAAAHHLSRVLRIKHQQQVYLFNGDNFNYLAEIQIDKKKVFAQILNKELNLTNSSINITLLQGISKGERMDLAIQKAVELGVTRIIPVICQHTVVNLKADRAEKKLRHWNGVVIHACEQSGRSTLPIIDSIMNFSDALNFLSSEDLNITLDPYAQQSLLALKTPASNNFNLLIGPEGGLSESEVEQSQQSSFQAVQLGSRILRTETAALASISAIQTLWGDFKTVSTSEQT